MDMQGHILAALKEQFDRWEELLGELSEEQVSAPRFDDGWSVKDVMAHLWIWQQISVVRTQSAALDREPVFPGWMAELSPEWEENADQTNAWIYKTHHREPWSKIHQSWKEGFLRLLELGREIPEVDFLSAGRYPWLKGYSPAFILIASYDHHQEHYDKLLTWLQGQGRKQ